MKTEILFAAVPSQGECSAGPDDWRLCDSGVAGEVGHGSAMMTFMENHEGVVFEKDLGADTAAVVQKIPGFNPDKSWKRL